MLGEQIYEARGKRTGRRVLSVDGGFKVEVSFEGAGKLLGVDANEIGTYWSESRPDGSLYGEGQGVVLAQDGTAATWKGAGVGRFVGGGAVSYRGAVYYSSAAPKFARSILSPSFSNSRSMLKGTPTRKGGSGSNTEDHGNT